MVLCQSTVGIGLIWSPDCHRSCCWCIVVIVRCDWDCVSRPNLWQCHPHSSAITTHIECIKLIATATIQSGKLAPRYLWWYTPCNINPVRSYLVPVERYENHVQYVIIILIGMVLCAINLLLGLGGSTDDDLLVGSLGPRIFSSRG